MIESFDCFNKHIESSFELLTNTRYHKLDIDECPEGVCDQLCTNIPGSYVCDCHAGYQLIGDHCQGNF